MKTTFNEKFKTNLRKSNLNCLMTFKLPNLKIMLTFVKKEPKVS